MTNILDSLSQPVIQLDNLSSSETVVSLCRVASTHCTALRGLIGYGPLEPGEGLLVVPCRSIHTQFISFPIDVLYVDRE